MVNQKNIYLTQKKELIEEETKKDRQYTKKHQKNPKNKNGKYKSYLIRIIISNHFNQEVEIARMNKIYIGGIFLLNATQEQNQGPQSPVVSLTQRSTG